MAAGPPWEDCTRANATFPMAPSSISRRASAHSRFRMSIGAQTISRPARSAASISSPACARVDASGFSVTRCFPAARMRSDVS